MIKLNIWITLSDGRCLQAGETVVADPDQQGRLNGQFRYDPDYLKEPAAIPLDPIHLPLSEKIFDADRPHAGVHGVFEDSLPDEWGRRILVRRYNLGRDRQRVPNLLQVLGIQGMGALGFSEGNRPESPQRLPDTRQLEELLRQAERFEQDATMVDDELALLFQAGSSPDGARPKALIDDRGKHYLAKFGSIRDQLDVVALEAATMELARRAGIDTPDTRLVPCGSKKVLLVERFDINAAGGRNHMISMQSLLRADGYYNAGYRDMADVVRQVSGNPAEDLSGLFKQMLFNVMIGNTDDHLKNFCMLHDGAEWRLSPAFDLVPNIGRNREHVLRIGHSAIPPVRHDLVQEAKFFGIKRQKNAEEIMHAVLAVVAGWRTAFKEFGVPEKEMERIGRDIAERLERR